jgi:hypothetical protein
MSKTRISFSAERADYIVVEGTLDETLDALAESNRVSGFSQLTQVETGRGRQTAPEKILVNAEGIRYLTHEK